MRLYGSYTSPFVRHCRIVLAETALSAEFIETAGNDPRNKSPTRRVPYFEDGSVRLSDSTSILRYLREKSGGTFLPNVEALDSYCLVNTLLDAGVNVFLFERVDGLLPEKSEYLRRQVARVESGLAELNARAWPADLRGNDAAIRLACFLAWGRFRKRFTIEGMDSLKAVLAAADEWEHFAATAPPAGA